MADEGDRAALTIAGMGMLWGSIGVVVRQVELPAVAVVWSRLVFALPVLAWFVLRRQGRVLRRPSGMLFANGAILALHWAAFVAALQRAPIGTVLLITYLAPVGIAALAPKVLGEQVTRNVILAIALGVGGVALIALPSLDGSSADGVALAVVTGIAYIALALLNKRLADEIGGTELALWQMLIACALLSPVAAFADWGGPTGSWLWLPVLGCVYTAFGFGLYLTALEKVDASRAVVLLYLEPASAIAFGWVFLDERPSALTVVGGLAIVVAGLLVLRSPSSEVVAVTPPTAGSA